MTERSNFIYQKAFLFSDRDYPRGILLKCMAELIEFPATEPAAFAILRDHHGVFIEVFLNGLSRPDDENSWSHPRYLLSVREQMRHGKAQEGLSRVGYAAYADSRRCVERLLDGMDEDTVKAALRVSDLAGLYAVYPKLTQVPARVNHFMNAGQRFGIHLTYVHGDLAKTHFKDRDNAPSISNFARMCKAGTLEPSQVMRIAATYANERPPLTVDWNVVATGMESGLPLDYTLAIL